MASREGRGRYHCSFCGKGQHQVKRLVAGPGGVFICDECVSFCQRIIQEEGPQPKKSPEKVVPFKALTPKEIFDHLNEYVVGQERAKKVLSVAVYNHYKRITAQQRGGLELDKTNILFIGPTGCGKTLLAQTLARILDVPLAISDATALTEAGYVGEDVENILLRLVQAADYDIPRAEMGIAYIDEIDKIARKEGANPSITRDVSGEGVQQGLLKIIEGAVVNVPPQGGRKHPYQEFLQVDTRNILFICGGTFEGLEKIVEHRIAKERGTMGFRARFPDRKSPRYIGELLSHTCSDDLMSYGLIPEMVSRLHMVVSLDHLTKEDLVRILTEPKNALIKQYQHIFSLDSVTLAFTPEALEIAAEQSLAKKTGARGLRSVIENILIDVMYEIPSRKDVRNCIIDHEVIMGNKRPLLYADGQSPPFPLSGQAA